MVTLHNGDCLEYMKSLQTGSIDAVISDPPYGVGIADWDGDMPPQDFLDECLRVARGCIVWFGAASMILEFSRYAPRPERMLIWSPKFTLSKVAKDGFAYRYHPIALWRVEKQDVIAWDVLDDMTEGGNWWKHPATKPVSLMRKLVSAFSQESVLDPFMGSGTTGVAALQLGRSFIGCEIDPKYFAVAEKRIKQAALQPGLFTPANNRLPLDVSGSPAQQALFAAEAEGAEDGAKQESEKK